MTNKMIVERLRHVVAAHGGLTNGTILLALVSEAADRIDALSLDLAAARGKALEEAIAKAFSDGREFELNFHFEANDGKLLGSDYAAAEIERITSAP